MSTTISSNRLVEARPPSTLYQLRKAVKRHRVAFLSATVVALTLVITTGISVWQAVRANQNAVIASQEAGRASDAEIRATDALNAERDIRVRSQRQAYQYGLNLAYEAWNQGDRGQFEQLVMDLVPAPGQEDFRGIEWRHLFARYRELQRAPVAATGQPATSIAYSPDGDYFGNRLWSSPVTRSCVWERRGTAS